MILSDVGGIGTARKLSTSDMLRVQPQPRRGDRCPTVLGAFQDIVRHESSDQLALTNLLHAYWHVVTRNDLCEPRV